MGAIRQCQGRPARFPGPGHHALNCDIAGNRWRVARRLAVGTLRQLQPRKVRHTDEADGLRQCVDPKLARGGGQHVTQAYVNTQGQPVLQGALVGLSSSFSEWLGKPPGVYIPSACVLRVLLSLQSVCIHA